MLTVKLWDDELLLLRRDALQRFLDDPTAVHLERQRLNVWTELEEKNIHLKAVWKDMEFGCKQCQIIHFFAR